MQNTLLMIGIIVLIVLIIAYIARQLKSILIILLLGVVAFSVYDIGVKKVNPVTEVVYWKTDAVYSGNMVKYTNEVVQHVASIRQIAGSDTINSSNLTSLTAEVNKLHTIQTDISKLEHSPKLNEFHSSYVKSLGSVITCCDTLVSIGNKKSDISQSQAMSGVTDALSKLKSLNIE